MILGGWGNFHFWIWSIILPYQSKNNPLTKSGMCTSTASTLWHVPPKTATFSPQQRRFQNFEKNAPCCRTPNISYLFNWKFLQKISATISQLCCWLISNLLYLLYARESRLEGIIFYWGRNKMNNNNSNNVCSTVDMLLGIFVGLNNYCLYACMRIGLFARKSL